MRITFLFCTYLLLFSFSSLAQNSWMELGKDTTSSTGNSYSNFCRDANGNVYAGIGRTVHKWNKVNLAWDQVGGDILASDFRLSCITSDGAGNIYAAGTKGSTRTVAKWNGSVWSELAIPPQLNIYDNIYAIATDRSGNIYIGGAFQINGYVTVLRWTGSTWVEVGKSNSFLYAFNQINCMTTDPAGNLYVAGNFRNTRSPNYCYVSKWDGNTWSELGGPSALKANDYIQTITSDSSGNIYAAGLFTNALGKKYVAKYNGVSWAEVGSDSNALNANRNINSIEADTSGNLYAGGFFTNAYNKYYVAKWNGVSWKAIGSGVDTININSGVGALTADFEGNVFAVGGFTNRYGKKYIVRWDKVKWTDSGSDSVSIKSTSKINCVVSDKNGYIYAGISNFGANYVAKWDGTNWAPVGGNNPLLADNGILSIAIDSISGNIYAAGTFTKSDYRYVAKWDGTSWTELGTGVNALKANADIKSIVTDSAGNVYATGYFFKSNYNRYVAKWDGTSWSELGGTNALQAGSGIAAMTTDNAGNIYVATSDYRNGGYNNQLVKWNGTSWSNVGNLNYSGYPTSIAFGDSGKIFVAAGGVVRIWDGITWSTSGNFKDPVYGNPAVNTVAADKARNVYAGGLFVNNNRQKYVAKYNGTTWTELDTIKALNANGEILSLTTDGAGNVYAAGLFTNEKGFNYIARYGVDLSSLSTYTFTGNGNWNVPANWLNFTVPPAILANGREIIIDPAETSSTCILNGLQYLPDGSKLTVVAGKKLVILKDLKYQQ